MPFGFAKKIDKIEEKNKVLIMLGALMKATGLIQMDTLLNGLTKKFKHKFSQQVVDKNIQAVKRAYEEVTTE